MRNIFGLMGLCLVILLGSAQQLKAEELQLGKIHLQVTTPEGYIDTTKDMPKELYAQFRMSHLEPFKQYHQEFATTTAAQHAILLLDSKLMEKEIPEEKAALLLKQIGDSYHRTAKKVNADVKKNVNSVLNSISTAQVSDIAYLGESTQPGSISFLSLNKFVRAMDGVEQPVYVVIETTFLYLCKTIVIIYSYSTTSEPEIESNKEHAQKQTETIKAMLLAANEEFRSTESGVSHDEPSSKTFLRVLLVLILLGSVAALILYARKKRSMK